MTQSSHALKHVDPAPGADGPSATEAGAPEAVVELEPIDATGLETSPGVPEAGHGRGVADDATAEADAAAEPKAPLLTPFPKGKEVPHEPWPDTGHDREAKPRARWKKTLLNSLAYLSVLLAIAGALLAYAYFRPNRAEINPSLQFEQWVAVDDGMHNSNTDMIYWRGAFYMIHASSPWHFGSSDCKLVLHRSTDAKSWQTLVAFHGPGGNDIRDPKFAAIGDRLYLYVLINNSLMATPESTSMTYTTDGENWSDLQDMAPKGWLFWRPKTRDNLTWYCPAYWHGHGESVLLKSTDGAHWDRVSTIYEGDANDETDCEFLPDGRLVATARLEVSPDGAFGNKRGRTLIATAGPPYEHWLYETSDTTRLDGPCLFEYNGQVYAFGRRNPDPNRWPTNTASVFGRKRTAIYKVDPGGLTWLSDLPSAGDTSYAGVVVDGDALYACYYTSDITRDWPWIIGILSPSEIRMVKIDLPSLEAIAKSSASVNTP